VGFLLVEGGGVLESPSIQNGIRGFSLQLEKASQPVTHHLVAGCRIFFTQDVQSRQLCVAKHSGFAG
jgi:hypothetical protein